MLVNNVVEMIEWERGNDPENKQSTISEELFDVEITSNNLKVSNHNLPSSSRKLKSQINTSLNREQIDDFVNEMMNNSSVSFLKDET